MNPQDRYTQSIRKTNMVLYAHLLNEYNKNIKGLLESKEYFYDIDKTMKQYGLDMQIDDKEYTYKFNKNYENYRFTFEIKRFENQRVFNVEKKIDGQAKIKEILFDKNLKNNFYIIKNERFIKGIEKEAELRKMEKQFRDYGNDALVDDVFQIKIPDKYNLDFQISIQHNKQTMKITGYIVDLQFKKQTPHLQKNLYKLIQHNILDKDLIRFYYKIGLNLEVYKYVQKIKSILEFNFINYDEEISKNNQL